MSDPDALTAREVEILEATVAAWYCSDRPLLAPAGSSSSQLDWPPEAPLPTRDELRPLIQNKWLVADGTQAPDWVLLPSEATLAEFGDPVTPEVTEALKDPDQRLGLILEALVAACDVSSSRPIEVKRYPNQTDVVMTSGWELLQPDEPTQEDFIDLQTVGLASVVTVRPGSIEVIPTAAGERAVHGALEALHELLENAPDAAARDRLRAAQEQTGMAGEGRPPGELSGSIIRALTGRPAHSRRSSGSQ